MEQKTILTQAEYYLCSKAVIEHFPDLEKSRPFKSGYDWDNEEYYVIAVSDYDEILKYHNDVITPFNENSNYPIDFWLRQVCASQLDASKITLKQCKVLGIFRAVEYELNLTKETNIAYAIFSLSKKYKCANPIQFIEKLHKN